MKGSIAFSLRVWISAVCAFSAAGSAVPNPVTPAQAQQAAESNVIVILRDQLANVPPVRQAMAERTMALAASQSSLVSQLQQTRARKVTSFSTINAFATNVSAAEAAQLAAHPLVQAVVPDRVIRVQSHGKSALTAPGQPGVSTNAGTANSAGPSSQLCGTLEPEALQLTNTAFLSSSTASAQTVLDGNGQPVTGKGVKVAFIADGLDTTVPGFIRPDGSRVFIDYQDFSGDPAGTPTAGGEAFGDASSIAAQDTPKGKLLTYDIGKFVNAAHPLPSPCPIHIRGMAPGASLVGLKVVSNLGFTTTSDFVEAIEYAVTHDDVDVLNESFGGNPFPDTGSDPISLANHAAVEAGVTVTVSSGDAGSMGTIGSPATDPYVISAGASTQFRLYAQTNYGAQPLAKGYLSGNISAFSSGGFAQSTPRTVDVVAPGDLGWALCSSNATLYTDCVDFETTPQPTPIQDFGGTSESSPLTAGEAALVIQAYRSTHGGKTPSPALVKQIIMSTATDLGAPTSEQGAGLINALGAVQMALSIDDSNGRPKAHGSGLLSNTASVDVTGAPNTRESQTFKITNTGTETRQITPALQTLGAPVAGATLNLHLDPNSDPTFINPTGDPRSYIKQKFTVPANVEHLDAAIAYQVSLTSTATPIVYISLLDPSGQQVAYNIPQGLGSGYGHVDIVKPAAGSWTAIIWTRPSGVGTYAGPVQFTWAAENFVNMGTVSPAKVRLAPGASASFTADFFTPSEPGDLAAGIRFSETDGNYELPEIPVTMRTLIPVGPTGGSFSGTLTGGNGRAGAGPTQTFEFDVPNGVKNMSLVVPISDNGYLLEGLLVDPQGMQLSVELNVDPFGAPQYALQHFRYNPQPGRWHFVLLQNFTSSGNQTSLPFTGRIGFNQAEVTASGLPNNPRTKLSASGQPVTATIEVINTGAVTEAYFADARLNTQGVVALAQQPCAAVATLPGTCGLFYVPTEVTTVLYTAQSTVPISMDAYNDVGYNVGGTGSPDIFAKKISADAVEASLIEPEIPYGAWYVIPSLIGPFGPAGAPTKPVSMNAFALMQPFDTAISADSGDIWADLTVGTNTYNPLVISSGEAGTITLTITPDPTQVGKTISGYVYVDTFNGFVSTGDEVVRIPYSYTVAP
jgi:Subtilase family/Peptidase inhibitor I9